MLNVESFRDQFHPEWFEKIKPWIESQDAEEVYKYLKSRSRDGCRIFPAPDRTFTAFKYASPKNLKAIIVGLSPYHTSIEGIPNADGLAFSNSLTRKESPSLELFLDGIEEDLDKKIQREPNLQYLAEQGVLLLNYSLTSEYGKATIHSESNLWGSFNKFLYGDILRSECGIPILLCGKQAHAIEKFLFNMCHVVKKVEHPAAAARDRRSWEHNGAFNWINKILHENNGEFSHIMWDSYDWEAVPF